MDDEDTQYEDPNESETGALGSIASGLQDLVDPTTTAEAQNYSRRILNKTLNSPYEKTQSQLFSDLEKSTEEARSALRMAKDKLMARKLNPADKWYSLAQAWGTPTKTGAFAENLAGVAGALKETSGKQQELQETQDKGSLDYDEQMATLQQKLLSAKLAALGATRKEDVDLSKEALKTLGKRIAAPGNIQNKATQAMDRAYAKEYTEWIQNGEPEASQALGELNQSLGNLRGYQVDASGRKVPTKGGKSDSLTGPIVGTMSQLPVIGKPLQDIFLPDSSNTQEMIESTVQRSLRPILGAQFTEKEGERLISRVYNPRLEEEVNAARVDRLVTKLRNAYNNKQQASIYFRKNGTLLGFKPKHSFTINDFMPDSSWPGESSGGGGTDDRDDDTPATDPNAPPAKKAATSEPGHVRFEDLPKTNKKPMGFMGFAEGGQVPAGKILVDMPDGTVVVADENATQEDLGSVESDPDSGGDTDRTLKRTLFGAAAGAGAGLAGSRAALRGATSLADLLPGRKIQPAEARLLALMEKAGMSPSDVTTNVRRSQRRGVPATVLDSGPDSFQGTARMALPQGGAETQDLLDRLTARQAGARERVNDQVNTGLKPDEYFQKEKDLKDELYTNAKPLYDQAYAQHTSVASPELYQLMNTPSGKIAVKKAVKAIRDKPGATIGKTNAMGLVTNPTLEFHDEVKKQLDDMITKEEGAGPSRVATNEGKRLRALRDSYVGGLDRATTDANGKSLYADARAQYSGDAQVLSALRSGREDFGSLQPQQVAKQMAGMSFAEKDAYRSGVAQNLYEMLNKPSTDINAARRLAGSPAMRAKLTSMFDTPAQANIFLSALDQESQMFEDSKGILNQKGPIDLRAAQPRGNALQRGAQKAPMLGIFSPTHWALKLIRSKPEISDREASQVISLLKSQTPDELAAFERLGPKFGRAAARKSARSKVGMIGAGIGAVAGALMGGRDNAAPAEETPDPNDPELAGMDEATRKWVTTPAKKRGGRIRFAEGGKAAGLMQLVKLLQEQHAGLPQGAAPVREAVHSLADQHGVTPRSIWEMFDGNDQTTQPATAKPAVVPSSDIMAPAQPALPAAQLDTLRKAIAQQKARMEQINQIAGNRPVNSSRSDIDPLTNASAVTQAVLDTAMQNPTMENYNRLQQMVRSLADQAGLKRGGSVRRMMGGVMNHG